MTLEELLAKPEPNSPTYHYNLGTLYLRSGNPGLAVSHLEKARALGLNDSEASAQRDQAKQELSLSIGENRLDGGSTLLHRVGDGITSTTHDLFVGALLCIGALLFVFSVIRRRRVQLALRSTMGVLAVISWLLASGVVVLFMTSRATPPLMAIQATSIRSGPGESFLELEPLMPGMKTRHTRVQQTDSTGSNWLQIRFREGRIGWIPAAAVLPL